MTGGRLLQHVAIDLLLGQHGIGAIECSSVGQGRNEIGHLQGGRQGVALADGDRERFPTVPGLSSRLAFPLFRWHEARLFRPHGDTRGLANSKRTRIVRQAVNADFFSHFVKIHITRLDEGLIQVDTSVARVFPVAEGAASVGIMSLTTDFSLRGDDTLLKSGESRDDFEN